MEGLCYGPPFSFPIADCRLPIVAFQLPIADCRRLLLNLGTATNRQLAIGNWQCNTLAMHSRVSCLLLSLLLLPFQLPRDSIRQHYEAAEARHRAGDLVAAEAEYVAILVEGYQR